MTWPALVLWALIVWGAASRGPQLLYVFGLCGAIGTLQMLPGEALGGANLLPQSVCAAFLIGKILLQRGNLMRGLALGVDPRRLGLLVAFAAYAVPAAVILPRLFAGQVEVITVSAGVDGASLLQPTFAVFTQSGYMVLSIATAVAVAVVGGQPDFRRHYLGSVLVGGLALIATGLVDLLTYAAGLSSLLDPFRNASYSLLTDSEALGAKRVVGLMSEASAYGALCVTALAALAFLRPCFEPRLRRTLVPLTIAGLLGMAVISTSSSAYVGLGVFAAMFGCNWLIRVGAGAVPGREGLRSELVLIVLAGFGLFCVAVLAPQLLNPVYDMFDAIVLNKTASSSFAERSSWTALGWNALWATNGLGVGLGSVRVSNWFVSILASTGLFGALLMFGFIARAMLSPRRPASADRREWRRGLRFTLVPSLFMALLAGTIPDIGVATGALYGLLVALDGPMPVREPELDAPA